MSVDSVLLVGYCSLRKNYFSGN